MSWTIYRVRVTSCCEVVYTAVVLPDPAHGTDRRLDYGSETTEEQSHLEVGLIEQCFGKEEKDCISS